ncbi:hypothetical protein [Clostridium sp. FP1]|uniref:hypothetical protein n=1 Tax=Clostridium sp. FP1 TaxID=2724076 RepID=UPI0013E92FA7|nr:hypothetical protein [Clostridium sp. FP1]MBZ9633318.1 hypothetical protein [Clostridium sp. FP1]
MFYEKIHAKNVDLVLTNNEYGYKEVVDSFANSSHIIIITYSIHKDLLAQLYKLDKDKSIIIVTNIPARFEKYNSETQKANARKQISITEHILDTSKFKAFTTTFFNFNNHSKIIISDSVAYIGSQNFYGSTSWECGTLIRSKSEINEIKDKFINEILDCSIPYNYKYDLSHLDDILELLKRLHSTLEEYLEIAHSEYWDCGIHAEFVIFKKHTLLNITDILLNLNSIIARSDTPTTIRNIVNSFSYIFYKSLGNRLNISVIPTPVTNINTIDYCNLFSRILNILNACDMYFYEFCPIENIEDISDSIDGLNCEVEDYIINFYRFQENNSVQPIDNTLE